MMLSPQLIELLKETARATPLGPDEYRRIPRMGMHHLTRGNLAAAARNPAYTPLVSLRIDGEVYALCVPAQ